MSREFKFRAWDNNLKEMIPVHNINFESKMINIDLVWRRFDEIELMQHTGEHDDNGVDIYEGDLVKTIDGIMEIRYMKDSFQCINIHTERNDRLFDYIYNGCIKVIGNKYENPELLEVK